MDLFYSIYHLPVFSEKYPWLYQGPSLSSQFGLANDNSARLKRKILKAPDKELCDAVVNQNDVAFKMAIRLHVATQGGLNKALFLAMGYERKEYYEILMHEDSDLTKDKPRIPLSERTNGMLLRSVLKDDMAGVLFSLNRKADVNAHQDECFKQAILHDHRDIAEMLHSAGADMTVVLEDIPFMEKVHMMKGVTREAKMLVYRLAGEFDFGDILEPEPPSQEFKPVLF